MPMQETLRTELNAALRGGDTARRDTLRLLISSVHNAQIEAGHELNDDEVLRVLQKEAKERRESIEEFRKGNRQDLVDADQQQLEIIEGFLPAQMSEDEARAIVQSVIAEVGAAGARDLGKVMGPLMQRLGGRFDGRRANELVRELLGSG
jgi:uncharacterized protein